MQEITPHLIRDYCVEYCKGFSVNCSAEHCDWAKVVQGATGVLNRGWGYANPSPFKRAAAAAISIVAMAPIADHIPANLVKEHGLEEALAKQPKIFRAMTADAFARFVLEGAKIGDEGHAKVLEKPIDVSAHFYRDLLWVLTQASFENPGLFNPLCLIYEACAYQTNPTARYA